MLKRYTWIIATVFMVLVLAGCSLAAPLTRSAAPVAATPATTTPPAPAPTSAAPSAGAVAALEGTLEHIYSEVNPSVVTIRVVQTQEVNVPVLPEIPGFPFFGGPSAPQTQVQQALGSGFVWDKEGHIVTNNHVVAGADTISVTFYDGTTVPGKVVGADPASDLAVVKVNVPADQLRPVQMADST